MKEIKFLKMIIDRVRDLVSARQVALGYFLYVSIGTLLLLLPISHTETGNISLLSALFTATSAVSTTGLGVASTGNDFSVFGQIVILLLIQIGGIGYMTFGSFICLSRGKILGENQKKIGQTIFSLPENFCISQFIHNVFIFTVVIELLGAALLYYFFRKEGVDNPAWTAIFHSISAFCTAGFSLYDTSIEAFRSNVGINLTLSFLSYAGAIGFIVFLDFWNVFCGRRKHITFTSRIIISTSAWIIAIGTFLFFIQEPSIQSLPVKERFLGSLFQVVSASTTAGFNTLPIGSLSMTILFILIVIMVIGASPSGTGGGVKSTTFSAMYGVVKSVITGKSSTMCYGKEIPLEKWRLATAVFVFYVAIFMFGTYLLTLSESKDFLSLAFESASALGTVGISTGITGALSEIGKLIIIAMMFIGRLGPIVFGIALFFRISDDENDKDIAI